MLDSFVYEFDPQSNITKLTQQDGSYWSYGYDGRYRLTQAQRKNANATINAAYTYSYSVRDNLLTKVEPFTDDFNNGDTAPWSSWGNWDASGHSMRIAGASSAGFYQYNADADTELWFDYYSEDTSDSSYMAAVYMRYSTDRLAIYRDRMELQEWNGSDYAYVDKNTSATTSEDTWYRVRIVSDGENITVWRGLRDANYEQVLSITDCEHDTTSFLLFETANGGTYQFDNIRFLTDDTQTNIMSTTTTMLYTAANELTKTTCNAVDTTYVYDDWGRTVTKAMSGHQALYQYRYGDRLKQVTSSFPDDKALTQYTYDGLGRLRVEMVDSAIANWYRWDPAWNLVGIYGEGSDPNITWDIGDAQITPVWANPRTMYAGLLGASAGSDPDTGPYLYTYADHLGSPRRIRWQDKSSAAQYEFTPYGEIYHQEGQLIFGFTGHLWMSSVNMYYARNRFYNPSIGRWLTRDPLGMIDGPNMYDYAKNTPINLTDRSGLFGIPEVIACTIVLIIIMHAIEECMSELRRNHIKICAAPGDRSISVAGSTIPTMTLFPLLAAIILIMGWSIVRRTRRTSARSVSANDGLAEETVFLRKDNP